MPRCAFVLSIHGAEGVKKIVCVGGLYYRGKSVLIDYLNADLAALGVTVVDATQHARGEGIAGLSPRNLTNRGRRGQGVQLEFTEGARRVFLPDLDTRAGRENPSPHLARLTASIERAIAAMIAHQRPDPHL